MKVLYIAGMQRCGSTLLANVLGQIPGFINVGEVSLLHWRGILAPGDCGCGQPVGQCPIWGPVLDKVQAQLTPAERDRLRVNNQAVRGRHLLCPALHGGGKVLRDKVEPYYLEYLRTTYLQLQTSTRDRIIVDSSKSPAHLFLLDQLEQLDVRVVHLVRDPRAVALSQSRSKPIDPKGIAPPISSRPLIKSAQTWVGYNLAAQRYVASRGRPGCRVLYEDFCQAPRRHTQRIVEKLFEFQPELAFFKDEHTAELRPSHSFSGNINRFESGDVDIQLKEAWRTELSRKDRLAVLALTWPLLLAYGYPWRRST